MRVKIKVRQIYHKLVEVEVEVPIEEIEDVFCYLEENGESYSGKINKALDEAEYEQGFGLGEGMEEKESEEEWRYELPDHGNYGGHL